MDRECLSHDSRVKRSFQSNPATVWSGPRIAFFRMLCAESGIAHYGWMFGSSRPSTFPTRSRFAGGATCSFRSRCWCRESSTGLRSTSRRGSSRREPRCHATLRSFPVSQTSTSRIRDLREDGMAGRSTDCPACGAPVDDAWCPSCGLEQGGADAKALRDLSSRLAAADGELNVAWARRDELARELAARRLRWVSVASGPAWPPPPRPALRSPAPTVGEWNVERIRNVLLWLGATLLALSALTFTAVAWTHLGPGGR